VAGSLEQICFELKQIFAVTIAATATAGKAEGVIEWCNTAANSCSYVIEILDNVLDQSKLEQGKLVLDSKPVNLFVLCTSVMNMLLHTKKEGVRVVLDVAPGLVVMGDEVRSAVCWAQPVPSPTNPSLLQVRWAQLLVNLLSNSLKFCTNGEVRVTMRRANEGEQAEPRNRPEGGGGGNGRGSDVIEHGGLAAALEGAVAGGGGSESEGGGGGGGEGADSTGGPGVHGLFVEVVDSGPGLSAELKPRLFQRFVQVRENTTFSVHAQPAPLSPPHSALAPPHSPLTEICAERLPLRTNRRASSHRAASTRAPASA
jgi:signal transduction histidine kinase